MTKVHPSKVLQFGDLSLSVFRFEGAGFLLPSHDHSAAPETAHITIVTNGSFEVSGDGWVRVMGAGDIIDFAASQKHEFKALEPNSKLINIIKQYLRK